MSLPDPRHCQSLLHKAVQSLSHTGGCRASWDTMCLGGIEAAPKAFNTLGAGRYRGDPVSGADTERPCIRPLYLVQIQRRPGFSPEL